MVVNGIWFGVMTPWLYLGKYVVTSVLWINTLILKHMMIECLYSLVCLVEESISFTSWSIEYLHKIATGCMGSCGIIFHHLYQTNSSKMSVIYLPFICYLIVDLLVFISGFPWCLWKASSTWIETETGKRDNSRHPGLLSTGEDVQPILCVADAEILWTRSQVSGTLKFNLFWRLTFCL